MLVSSFTLLIFVFLRQYISFTGHFGSAISSSDHHLSYWKNVWAKNTNIAFADEETLDRSRAYSSQILEKGDEMHRPLNFSMTSDSIQHSINPMFTSKLFIHVWMMHTRPHSMQILFDSVAVYFLAYVRTITKKIFLFSGEDYMYKVKSLLIMIDKLIFDVLNGYSNILSTKW